LRVAAFATPAFGSPTSTNRARAREVSVAALRQDKTGRREDPAAAAEDRNDLGTLARLG
jgi:hypothetical protein